MNHVVDHIVPQQNQVVIPLKLSFCPWSSQYKTRKSSCVTTGDVLPATLASVVLLSGSRVPLSCLWGVLLSCLGVQKEHGIRAGVPHPCWQTHTCEKITFRRYKTFLFKLFKCLHDTEVLEAISVLIYTFTHHWNAKPRFNPRKWLCNPLISNSFTVAKVRCWCLIHGNVLLILKENFDFWWHLLKMSID